MKKNVLKEIKEFQDLFKSKNNYIPKEEFEMDNLTQMEIIKYLGDNKNKDINQKDIEEFTNFSKGTISSVLDTMEKKNKIVRLSDNNDARKKIIKLTEEEFSRYNEVKTKIRKVNNKVIMGISNDKLEIFFEVLDTMKKNLRGDEK